MHYKAYFFISLLIFFACSDEQVGDCFTSVGKIKTEIRTVPSFHSIDANHRFKITLVQDSIKQGQIELISGEHIIKGYTTEVSDGILKIRNKNKCDIVRAIQEPKIKIHFWKDLQNLNITSAASCINLGEIRLPMLQILGNSTSEIQLTDLSIDYIGFQLRKSTNLILQGKTIELRGQVNEVSNLYSLDLEAQNVLVDNHTVLDCYVDATKIIYVNIFNDGHIFYKRSPSEKLELVNGQGKGQLLLYTP